MLLQRRFGGPVRIDRMAPDSLSTESAPAAVLMPDESQSVTCRKVRLLCGRTTLSHATLWYVAARLPADMARELAQTTRPFGDVVRSLGLRRTTLSARLCTAEDAHALEHRALLSNPRGHPIALVEEIYDWVLFASS